MKSHVAAKRGGPSQKFSTEMKDLVHNALKSYVRNFPLNKGKGRVLSLLWEPLSFGQHVREANLRQANVRVRCDISRFIQRQLYFFGAYEEQSCEYWMRLAKKAQTIFDIGANVGLYSLLAAATNPQATIHAFEPTTDLFDAFVENLRLNDFSNVVANKLAIGQASEKSFLHRCTGSDGRNEGMNYICRESEAASDTPVEVVSLDNYCRANQIDLIDLLKLDIEGGEFEALLGAERLLAEKAIACIFVELTEWAANRSGHSTREIKRLLLNAGYQIRQLQNDFSLKPVELESSHNGDNIIALAVQPALIASARPV